MTPEPPSTFRSRLAPTPSGYLHLGNLCSFVRTWLITRKNNGHLLLRIDDIDNERSRQAYLEDIFTTLDFIGLDYHEGPAGVNDFSQNWSQHLRLPLYHQLLERLRAEGKLYACTCSRKGIAEASPNSIYPGTCRHKKLNLQTENVAWRMNLGSGGPIIFNDENLGQKTIDLNSEMGDFVVRGKNGLPAYQVASLADDLHFHVNYVVRGKDLLASTAAQIWLAKQTDAAAFQQIKWHHHHLLYNENAEKVSKSAGALSIQHMKNQGMNRGQLLQKIAAIWWPQHKPHAGIHTLANLYDFYLSVTEK